MDNAIRFRYRKPEPPCGCFALSVPDPFLPNENGTDIRDIQAMLGHAQLSTMRIYTQVSIKKLRQIHELTHPADRPPSEDDEIENATVRRTGSVHFGVVHFGMLNADHSQVRVGNALVQ